MSDMLAKLSRDGVEEICRRLTSVEGPDLGEEYSPAWLEGQIRDRFFGIKQDLEETTSLEDVADRSPAGAVCLGSFFQTT